MSTETAERAFNAFLALVALIVALGIGYGVGREKGDDAARFALSSKVDFERARYHAEAQRAALLEGELAALRPAARTVGTASTGTLRIVGASGTGTTFTTVATAYRMMAGGTDAAGIVRGIRTNDKGFVICAPPWEK